MHLLIIFFLLSITFSFLCSIWEAVLLSITPSYVTTEGNKGSSLGATLHSFKEDIDRPLSAILTLNTIAHTVGAIGVGAQSSAVFSASTKLPFGLSAESLIAGLMTLAILILSEIIPKTIGANNWKALTPFTIRSISILIKILAPFVWLSQLITKSLKKDKEASVLSRADFMAMTNVGKESGVLEENESAIINNLLGLNQIFIKDIMTPRTVIVAVSEEMSIGDYYNSKEMHRFSRIPVYKDRSDFISGVVLKDDMLVGMIENNESATLSTIKRPIKLIKQDETLTFLFEELTKEGDHIAVAIDDFGSVTGLVTLEDLFETIIGIEIVDETDGVEDMQALARKIYNDRLNKSKS